MEKKKSGWKEDRGKKGAAPFASIEDLSDDSPPGEDRARLEVPGCREGGPPRIDISRASSSSHHEDSSPERELFAGEGGGNVKVGLGFTEDMALELRSSTEELDFHEAEPERKTRRKKLQHQQQAVVVTKYDLETESEKENRERKDSGCSEGGLLFIGGRTSRLSSIGSAASGGSGVSASSNVSHLSAASNYSRASRCSSPHRMLLETSFCGPKPIPTLSLEAEYPPSESVEAALLKRKADPAGAILPNCLEVKDSKPRRCSSERTVRPQTNPAVRSSSARAPRKPVIKQPDNELFKIIPLHGSVDEPEDDETESNPPPDDDFNPENGIYIPLKGPIIDTRRTEEPRSKKSEDSRRKKPDIEESDLVRFISLHGDDDEEIQNKRNNQSVQFKPWTENSRQMRDWSDWPKPRSPDPPKPGRLELEKKKNGRSLGQIPRDDSRTPSPASSFSRGNIFRRSSDSSGSSKKSISSSDSKTKKDSKNKSMFTSLFKKNVKEATSPRSHHEKQPPIDPKLTNVEYKFRQDEHVIDKDTIIIPLHSPDEVVEPLIRYDPAKEDDLSREPPPPPLIRREKTKTEPVPENQRSSLEVHTIEKNIVVVDVINEDTKDPVVKPPPLKTPSETRKQQPKDTKRRVDELEVYEYEPRVRRSSSVCSRETDAVSLRNDKETEKENQNLKSEEGATKDNYVERQEHDEGKQKSDHIKQNNDLGKQREDVWNPEKLVLKQEKDIWELENELCKQELENVLKSKDDDFDRDLKVNEQEETLSKSESGGTDRQASQETVIENHLRDEDIDRRTDKSPIRDDIMSTVIQDEEMESLIKKDEDSENNLTKSEGHERRSSESEADLDKDSELECDEERKVLCHQAESVDDELPYVPTTLPQERSVAVPMIPVRQRVGEVKTCPVERPRSTTPIQPANLDEYAAFHEPRTVPQEKMQITLPRSESGKGRGRGKTSSPPPPLPPRAPQWVGFDEPERRRPPRRITTLPYTYVNPEECTCECHEAQHRLPGSHCSKSEQCSYTKKGARTEKEKRYRT